MSMSGKGRGPAVGIDHSGEEDMNFSKVSGTDPQVVLMSGDMTPVNTVSDAEKQKEDEEAKQMLVDMIVNDTILKTCFMDKLKQTKVDAGQSAWDEKRKLQKELSKKKREQVQKQREAKRKP